MHVAYDTATCDGCSNTATRRVDDLVLCDTCTDLIKDTGSFHSLPNGIFYCTDCGQHLDDNSVCPTPEYH